LRSQVPNRDLRHPHVLHRLPWEVGHPPFSEVLQAETSNLDLHCDVELEEHFGCENAKFPYCIKIRCEGPSPRWNKPSSGPIMRSPLS
jgi:hypothetical protein